MLTLFTTPKPFRGIFATIQRNALRSWTLLRPACDVLLFGNEDGIIQRGGPSQTGLGFGNQVVLAAVQRQFVPLRQDVGGVTDQGAGKLGQSFAGDRRNSNASQLPFQISLLTVLELVSRPVDSPDPPPPMRGSLEET